MTKHLVVRSRRSRTLVLALVLVAAVLPIARAVAMPATFRVTAQVLVPTGTTSATYSHRPLSSVRTWAVVMASPALKANIARQLRGTRPVQLEAHLIQGTNVIALSATSTDRHAAILWAHTAAQMLVAGVHRYSDDPLDQARVLGQSAPASGPAVLATLTQSAVAALVTVLIGLAALALSGARSGQRRDPVQSRATARPAGWTAVDVLRGYRTSVG